MSKRILSIVAFAAAGLASLSAQTVDRTKAPASPPIPGRAPIEEK